MKNAVSGAAWHKGRVNWPRPLEMRSSRRVARNRPASADFAREDRVKLWSNMIPALQEWRAQTAYRQDEDWVFASPKMHGKQPYWPETLLRCYVQPAVQRSGIAKQIGWHSFRRSFATLLKGTGEDVKTVQELMRHANSRLTLDVYAQALTPAKRAAHLKVVELIRPTLGTSVVPLCSRAEEASVCK
jgi:integrase